jgi:hypothetical protein
MRHPVAGGEFAQAAGIRAEPRTDDLDACNAADQ